MKNDGIGPTASEGAAGTVGGEGRTRTLVARTLLENGPTPAAQLADDLGLTPAAVRRHLDCLLAAGHVTTREAPSRGRGRGRPAKLFLITADGRAQFGHAYDDLAVAALRFVAETGGDEAVETFAQRRVGTLVERFRDRVGECSEPTERAEVLAEVLTENGYAASTRQVGSGAQLCQHHCPVAHVATEFPQLCEAETAAFAEVLGTHVQRLATIAGGDVVCTTHVPNQTTTKRHGGVSV